MVLAVALTTLTGSTAYAVQTVADGSGGGMPGMGPAAGPGPNTPSPELVNMLRSTGRTWSAATVGAQNSAALALASDTTVMGIGGFSGSDPAPTLQEFQALVAADEVRWFVDGGAGQGPGDGQQQPGPGSEILAWVQDTFLPTTVGDRTVYDFDRPLSPPPA
jgi:hypothetical protein